MMEMLRHSLTSEEHNLRMFELKFMICNIQENMSLIIEEQNNVLIVPKLMSV